MLILDIFLNNWRGLDIWKFHLRLYFLHFALGPWIPGDFPVAWSRGLRMCSFSWLWCRSQHPSTSSHAVTVDGRSASRCCSSCRARTSLLLYAVVSNSASGLGSHQEERRRPSSLSPPPQQVPPVPAPGQLNLNITSNSVFFAHGVRIKFYDFWLPWSSKKYVGLAGPYREGLIKYDMMMSQGFDIKWSFLKHHDASGQDNCVHMLTSHGIKWVSWAAVSLPYLDILKTKTASSEWHKVTACWLAQFVCCFLDSLGCQMFDKKYPFWTTNLIFTFTMTRSLMIRYENRRYYLVGSQVHKFFITWSKH